MIPVKTYVNIPLFNFPDILYSYNVKLFQKLSMEEIIKNGNHVALIFNDINANYIDIVKKYERKGLVFLIICAHDKTHYSIPYIGSDKLIKGLYTNKKVNKHPPKRYHCGINQQDYAYANNINATYKCYKHLFNNKISYINTPKFKPKFNKNRRLEWILSKRVDIYIIMGTNKSGKSYLADKISKKYQGKIFIKKNKEQMMIPFSVKEPIIIDASLKTVDQRLKFIDIFKQYNAKIMLIMVDLPHNMQKYMNHLTINNDSSGLKKYTNPRNITPESLESMHTILTNGYKCKFMGVYYFPHIESTLIF